MRKAIKNRLKGLFWGKQGGSRAIFCPSKYNPTIFLTISGQNRSSGREWTNHIIRITLNTYQYYIYYITTIHTLCIYSNILNYTDSYTIKILCKDKIFRRYKIHQAKDYRKRLGRSTRGGEEETSEETEGNTKTKSRDIWNTYKIQQNHIFVYSYIPRRCTCEIYGVLQIDCLFIYVRPMRVDEP